MKTVLITGCSSGFGLETAKYFLDRDWTVIATMRTPRDDVLPSSAHLKLLQLDVTDADSIRRAVEAAGPVDVLVNNAGVGMLGPFESTSMDAVREVFETNTFGTMAVTQALLPQFRARKAGVVINVASSVTLTSLPLLPVYTASKAAIVAFTASLALELKEFNIRVGVVLPGMAPETPFASNAHARVTQSFPDDYAPTMQAVLSGFQNYDGPVTHAADVAEVIWQAVHDSATAFRVPAGADAIEWFKRG
ncbi:SDR family oxidoreductase [Herbaspirillum sp. alder98]|uniref:SDR family oxidoreductase n=1 Tax=Herbaspirillum sp. alder98 TaxID=2913096 RepID=UPI001CD87833|nr:SDR family oxidoreductase [Herbaspirillum sp. alder98]MCA1325396.1 SDR family oxidoreductase [Herbaspirillum sp. alder98]